MTKRVRWLHLSDIHFRHKSKLDQGDAFARIRSEVAKRRNEGTGPDLIFVTGDITYSGQASDFGEISNRLHELRTECRLGTDRVFFCPGNHDSDIQKAPVLVRGCWSSLQNIAALPEFLTTGEYTSLKERQAAYCAFVRTFRSDSGGFDAFDLHALNQVSLGSLRVGALSINTALLADGGADDRGRLQVAIRTLEERRDDFREHHILFVLMHHPFDWLTAFEEDRVESFVYESALIVLRGHLHRPKVVASLRTAIVSAAGAVWEHTPSDYEYNFGCLSLDSLNCQIESVRFNQDTGRWMSRSEEMPFARSLDERCTPRAIYSELDSSLRFPAQVAAVLGGYSSELMLASFGAANYVSTERLLAEGVKQRADAPPALAVIRVGALLRVYGSSHISEIIGAERGALKEYDLALQAAAKSDLEFSREVDARERATARLVERVAARPPSWQTRYVARLVADGASQQIRALRDDSTGPLLAALQAALTDDRVDPYGAWLEAGGPDLDYPELVTIAQRLAVKPTVHLASAALLDAAKRFPSEARKLDSVAKIIASEAADEGIYASFRALIGLA